MQVEVEIQVPECSSWLPLEHAPSEHLISPVAHDGAAIAFIRDQSRAERRLLVEPSQQEERSDGATEADLRR